MAGSAVVAKARDAPGARFAGEADGRQRVSLKAARLFDGDHLVRDAVLDIDGSTITAVRTGLPGPDVVDLGDVTLLPGLIDTHQHLVFDGNGSLEDQVAGRSDLELRDRARLNARRALAAGITTIRDLGDRGFVTLELRGAPDLPTILAAGPPLTAAGGHCWFLGGECRDDEALLAAVAERRRRGCDVVKIMVTGGALTPNFPIWASQFTADQVAAVVAAAHASGLPVAAHCHGPEGTMHAVDAGVDTIEHCSFLADNGRCEPDDVLVERIAASGIPVSATLGRLAGHTAPPLVEENLHRIRDALRRLRASGATIAVGTDAGISAGKPHDVLAHACDDLAGLGLDGAEILTTLTTTAARVCGLAERKGRLAPGYDADVVAVGGNPVLDAHALVDVRGVWRSGKAVRND